MIGVYIYFYGWCIHLFCASSWCAYLFHASGWPWCVHLFRASGSFVNFNSLKWLVCVSILRESLVCVVILREWLVCVFILRA